MSVPKTLKGIAEEEDSERLVFDSYLKAIKPTADAALSGILLAQQEEHVLRCLGAALIMQWDTLPAKLRRDCSTTPVRWVSYYIRTICEAKSQPSFANIQTK